MSTRDERLLRFLLGYHSDEVSSDGLAALVYRLLDAVPRKAKGARSQRGIPSITDAAYRAFLLRFGTDDEPPKKRREIAARLGVSVARVAQLEKQTIRLVIRLMYDPQYRREGTEWCASLHDLLAWRKEHVRRWDA